MWLIHNQAMSPSANSSPKRTSIGTSTNNFSWTKTQFGQLILFENRCGSIPRWRGGGGVFMRNSGLVGVGVSPHRGANPFPWGDHSSEVTIPLLRPLIYSPNFSPMPSTLKLFSKATIPLFWFATTDFRPKRHIFPLLRNRVSIFVWNTNSFVVNNIMGIMCTFSIFS